MKDSTNPPDATSYKETAFGIISRSDLLTKEAEGIARGLEYILHLPEDTTLSPELLLEIHRVCFGWIFPEWAGKYRTIKVRTSSHEFPAPHEVPALIHDFFQDLRERLTHPFEPIEIIAWAQHRLVWIHPFKDYNGRTARLFSNYLMLTFNLPLSEINVESEAGRVTYIQSLKSADNGNLKPLEQLLRNAIENS
jgi:fido (protein-threonine AMPylation protein)